MVHRSHAPSGGPQPTTAPRLRARPNGLLALQRSAGNRAVRAVIARDTVATIGSGSRTSSPIPDD